jgi:hypothetical protein
MSIDFIGHLVVLEKTRGINSVVSVLKERAHALFAGEVSNFRTSENGSWFGCWRNFTLLAKRGRRGLRNALRILRVYGIFIHKPPMEKDYKVHAKAISENPERLVYYLVLPNHLSDFDSRAHEYKTDYPMSTKRCPLARGLKQPEVLTSPKEHIDSLSEFPNFVVEHYHVLKGLIGSDLPGIDFYFRLCQGGSTDYAGYAVLLSKDRGMKLRLIANCNRILQLVLSPLHKCLLDTLRKIPESFFEDQDGGAEKVIERLNTGTRLTSLDLLSASDNIPLGPQLDLAFELYPHLRTECLMFGQVARMSWRTPYQKVRWTRGHPMGVNVSFGLFTVWLVNMFYHIGAQDAFCIVGDDIVFESSFEPHVLAHLAYYGISVNNGKSLFGHVGLAEFVGRLIDSVGSLNVYKANQFRRSDPLGIIRQYGLKAIKYLGPKRLFNMSYREVVSAVLFYHDSRELKEGIKPYLRPYDVLNMESKLPLPLHAGGVSRHILVKMVKEIPLPVLSPENMIFLNRKLSWGEALTPREFQLELRQGEVARVSCMLPGQAYTYLINHEYARHVKAFTVETNEAYEIRLIQGLLARIKRCKSMEDALEILSGYEEIVDHQSLVINHHAPDISRAEDDAKAKRFRVNGTVKRPEAEPSAWFLVQMLRRAARHFNRKNHKQ